MKSYRLVMLGAVCLAVCGCGTKKSIEKGPILPGDYIVVDEKDDLSNIAVRAYGDRKLSFALLNANPGLVKRPGFDLILGETIKVPSKANLDRKHPMPVYPRQLPAEYIVLPGDSLRTIAKGCYGDRNLWKQIFDANRNTLSQHVEKNPHALIAGQVLHIPAKKDQPESARQDAANPKKRRE